MRAVARTIAIAAVLTSSAGMARAAEVRVLSVGAVQVALKALAADFSKASGHHVVLTIGSPVVVMQKLKADEVYDAVIVSEPAMDVLDKEGIINGESIVRLVNTGLGVAVRAGAPVPDVSTPDAFRQALMNAKSIVYGDPTLPNQSGEKAERILAKAGLLDALKPKLRVVPGQAASQEMIAKGEIELGLYNVSEIPQDKGLELAGAVPAPLQIDTTYEAAMTSDGEAFEATRAFILHLADPDARATWLAARLEPLSDH
jgi:molybdate transport system substrate-binding protein